MTNLNDPDLDTLFRALADPTRRAVVAQLTSGPKPVKTLAQPHDMALPSFLQHLKVLQDGGLVFSEKQGRTRVCRLAPERLATATDWLSQLHRMWESRLDRLDHLIETLDTGDNT